MGAPILIAQLRRLQFHEVHRTLRLRPAMAAGVTERLWSVEDLVASRIPTSGARKGRHRMSIPEDVTGFLWRHVGVAYCDDCIEAKLRLKRRQAQSLTDAISETHKFIRYIGVCSDCRVAKLVTRAAE